jgi:hypothetical protein
MSDRKIINVCNDKIEATFFNCFGQLVEILRLLQFWALKDKNDILL